MPLAAQAVDAAPSPSPFQPSAALAGAARPARGAWLWSDQGAPLIDFCCGFGDILLGHAHPAVDAAVRAAWADAEPAARLRDAAAERLLALLPFAECARFAATPGDAP